MSSDRIPRREEATSSQDPFLRSLHGSRAPANSSDAQPVTSQPGGVPDGRPTTWVNPVHTGFASAFKSANRGPMSSSEHRLPGIRDLRLLSTASISATSPAAQDQAGVPDTDGGNATSTPTISTSPLGLNHSNGDSQYQPSPQARDETQPSASAHVERAQAFISPPIPGHLSRPSSSYFERIPPPQRQGSAMSISSPQPSNLLSPYDRSQGQSHSGYFAAPQPAPTNHRREGSGSGPFGDRPPVPLGQYYDPNRGAFFHYSDGSTIPTEVGGQPVNPHHGITKQGNPRKRGSHACVNCRNKKVKCESDQSDINGPCRACARGQQPCNWQVHPTYDRASPDVFSDPGTPGVPKKGRSRQSADETYEQAEPYPTATPMVETMELDEPVGPISKRPRIERQETVQLAPALSHIPPMDIGFHEKSDPAQLNYRVTSQLLDLYFIYRDRCCTQVLPRQAFMDWTMKALNKTPSERMVVYSCMALGSIFATSVELKKYGNDACTVAKHLEASKAGTFSLKLVLTRLHLALWSWAKGHDRRSFEYTGSACRALSALSYNTEEGCLDDVDESPERNDFYLSATQLVECRRRTFWLGYFTEYSDSVFQRYNGHCSGSSALLPNADIFVRVPNNEAAFEQGVRSQGPLFSEGKFDPRTTDNGLMAAFVGIMSTWGEVTANIYRTFHRHPGETYSQDFELFHTNMSYRLKIWEEALPSNMKYTPANTAHFLRAEHGFSPYYVLQSIYHATLIKLNRHFRFALLSTASTQRKISTAQNAGREYLELISSVARHVNSETPRLSHVDNALSQPFPAYTILTACDVVSRGGPAFELRTVNTAVINAVKVLEEHGRFFDSARRQRALVHQRMTALGGWKMTLASPLLPEGHAAPQDGTGMSWQFPTPEEKSFTPLEMDAIYGTDEALYRGAAQTEIASVD